MGQGPPLASVGSVLRLVLIGEWAGERPSERKKRQGECQTSFSKVLFWIHGDDFQDSNLIHCHSSSWIGFFVQAYLLDLGWKQ